MRKLINPDKSGGLQPYDRPNQAWRCGNEENGCPCSVRPTPQGSCPEATECNPVRDGDRWICNRPATRGGPCDDQSPGGGPTPDGQCCLIQKCQPRKTLRSHRKHWIRGAAIFAFGALLMLFGSGKTNNWLAPGPLTTHHAQIIRKDAWDQRCASCHPAGMDSPMAWIGHASGLRIIHDESGDSITQSSLCLNCHESLSKPEAAPLFAHGLSQEALANSNRSRTVQLLQVSFNSEASRGDEIGCAACHQEHHGASFNLTHINNGRCQSCHQEQYNSFADGHPEFSSWPSTSKTGILFNHSTHKDFHFSKANQKFDCRSCHLEDQQADLTQLASYESSCASCHDREIRESLAKGIALLKLPTIDAEALTDSGLSDNNWPKGAQDDFDGALSPWMKLLLAADDEAAQTMRNLGEDFSFFDIDATDVNQLKQAEIILQAIRELAYDLQEEGHGAILYRLRKVLGRSDLPVAEADFVSKLPVELIDQLQTEWFKEEGISSEKTFEEVEDRTTGGGWQLDSESYSLKYLGTTHADPLMKAWLDVIVTLPQERESLRDALLTDLKQPSAPGQCLSCHELQPNQDNTLTIRWEGRDRSTEPKGFTKFSHRPHLHQPELANCTHCHQLAGQVSKLFSLNDETNKQSDFATLKKQSCTSCHVAKSAGDQCSVCHNYHVDPKSLETYRTKP